MISAATSIHSLTQDENEKIATGCAEGGTNSHLAPSLGDAAAVKITPKKTNT